MTRTLLPLVAILLALPASAESQQSRQPRKKPFAELSESAQRLKDSVASKVASISTPAQTPLLALSVEDETRLRDSIVAVARAQIGTRYRLGAQSPGKAFDCSGLIRHVLTFFGVELPRTANEQGKVGEAVALSIDELRPGDIVTFGRGKRATHIGIYVGDGRIVHASTTKKRVIESTLAGENWYSRRWNGARRLLATSEWTDSASVSR